VNAHSALAGALDELAALGTDRDREQIAAVRDRLDAARLRVLVAGEALETMDVAVFVLTADPPVSAAERDLYAKVTGLSAATFTVLNKADQLDEAGLLEAAEFTDNSGG
jgi:predicted GTPase